MDITIDEGVTLEDYQRTYGYTEEELRIANPGLGKDLVAGQMIELPSAERLNDLYQQQEFAIQNRAPSFRDELKYEHERPVTQETETTALPYELPAFFDEPMKMMASHTDDKIGDFLGERISTLGDTVPQKEFVPPATQEQHDMLAEELKKKDYLARIAEIETGSQPNEFIRTKAYGSGSSAYGPYQVTMGLTNDYLMNHSEMFTPEELKELQDVKERQEISLAVGGSDRKDYEQGGVKAYEGQRLATKFGYSDVGQFLDAFDYGGDFGYKGDKVALRAAQERMALKHYEDTGGDEVEAAAQWHGGKNWKESSHLPKTLDYIKKYKTLQSRG